MSHDKRFKRFKEFEEMSAGGGAVAGLGQPPGSSFGEHPQQATALSGATTKTRKKNKRPVEEDASFNGYEFDELYNFVYKMKPGEGFRVGAVRFILKRFNPYPIFTKKGSFGSKLYSADWKEGGLVGMYEIGGSGQQISDYVVVGKPLKESVLHEAYADDAKNFPSNPFEKLLRSYKFVMASSGVQPNKFARNDRSADVLRSIWVRPYPSAGAPDLGKSHIEVWQYRDGTKTFISRFEQPNGIMSPSTGDTKGQLERVLTSRYDFGLVKEASEAEIETAAKQVHDTWVANQKKDGKEEHKSPDGKEDYMVPYEKLKEKSKDMDRDAVKATLDALGLGEKLDYKDGGEIAEEREKFAGSPVFEVDTDKWMKSRFGKNRYHRYSRYVGEGGSGEEIRQHGRTQRKDDIILKDQATGAMTYFLRRKRKSA